MRIQIYRMSGEWWHQPGIPNPHWTVVLYHEVLATKVVDAIDSMSATWEEAQDTARRLWNQLND